MSRMELLSPAGGFEALRAAVQNGADAVYLGEKSFSARQSAENFDDNVLKDAVRYAHERGTKVYLAMNTLLKDKELKSFENGVAKAAQAGVNALIIQDFGGAHIAKEVCPDMPIHASTQMSAHNEKDVVSLLERGFSRIVLARELKKAEIEKIYNNTRASLEVFVHGALCVCVSGQCLMSSFIGGRSGNRGRCAQPCRQMYTAEGKKGYFLSPRDLCLLDELSAMEKIGVDSLKIEGRMKSPEYVARVTGIYRDYIDNPRPAQKHDVEELEKIFVRGDGFTKAYFSGVNTPEMMNYKLSNDNISQRSDKETIKKAQQSYRDGVENKKTKVDAYLTLREGEKSSLMLTDGENFAHVYGAVPETALNIALDEVSARERIAKMGQTPFVLNGFEFVSDKNLTLSAKDINSLRREASEKLMEERGKVAEREIFPFEYTYPKTKKTETKISVSILNEKQLEGCREADFVYMPLSVYEKSEKEDNYIPILPKVVYNTARMIERLKKSGAKRVLASTVGVVKALKKEGFEVFGDYGLNVFNSVSANEYYDFGIENVTLSPELNLEEIREIIKNTNAKCEVICYGRMLLMTTRACIIKGVRGKCECEKPLHLTDKTGASFYVCSDKDEHINMLYNSHVTFMADKKDSLNSLSCDRLRLVFTDESDREISETIRMYKGLSPVKVPERFTRGYFNK